MLGSKKFFLFSLTVFLLGVGLMQARKGPIFLKKTKTAEEYWAATGLTPDPLQELLSEDKCGSSERYFLSCVNAIISMANRLNLNLSHRGELIPLHRFSTLGFLTEKERLEPWQKFYLNYPRKAAQINFEILFTKLNSEVVTDAQRQLIVGLGLNGFISIFKDPHTYLMPVDQFNEVVSQADNRSTSLGIVLGNYKQNHVVKKVVEGSPAKLAGVNRGDIIQSIKEIPVAGLGLSRVQELLRGDVGDLTKIELLRDNQKITVELKRREITIATVSTAVIEGAQRLGVIGINKFAKGACDKVKVALKDLKRAQVRGLLLDLRDNPGGQLEEAACISSLFVGRDKKIFEIRYLDDEKSDELYFGEEEKLFDGPMAILINGSSASASEIVAGSLQDHQRAILVGERTFGKGSFQEGEYWSMNSNLALFETRGFFYLPSGRSPQLSGLIPDVEVKYDEYFSGGERDQFMNPLSAPSSAKSERVTKLSKPKCLISKAQTGEDLQFSKARQILICAQAEERVEK